MEDEDPMDVFQQQKEMSTEKGGRYFIPEFCYKPRNILLWKAAARLPHTLTTTLYFSLLFRSPVPIPFLNIKSLVYCTSTLPCSLLVDIRWRRAGKVVVL